MYLNMKKRVSMKITKAYTYNKLTSKTCMCTKITKAHCVSENRFSGSCCIIKECKLTQLGMLGASVTFISIFNARYFLLLIIFVIHLKVLDLTNR